MEWKTIDSAPKDGTSVIVYNGRYVEKAYWNNEPNIWERENAPCWTVFEPDDFFYAYHLNDDPPTHWTDIPPPPTETGNE